MERTRTRRRWPYVLAAIALLIAVIILLWDWNWFKPLVESRASAALGREVTLRHFDLKLSRHPLIIADGIAIANPEEFPPDSHLGSVERLAVRVNPWEWFDDKLTLLSIELDQPKGDLRPGPSGKPNYLIGPLDPEAPPSEPSKLTVDIGELIIRDGDIHVVEPKYKADFSLKVRTLPATADGESSIRVDADGKYNGAPIKGRFIGGSVLSLREPAQPYPVDLEARNGNTEVMLKGTVQNPVQFGGARLKLDLKGDDLAQLYALTGVPLPPSPPYKVSGQLDYTQGLIRFRKFNGTVGQSDLSGDVAVDLRPKRRRITVDAQSNKVVLQDLGGMIGAPPGKDDAPTQAPKQDKERAQQQASGKLLPDKPLALPRIRAADMDVHYQARRIESDKVPVDNLDLRLSIVDGLITVKPLRFGVGNGSIQANIQLDGREDVVPVKADIDFRQLDLAHIMSKATAFKGKGTIGGSARIDTRGNSLSDMLGRGNGDLKLYAAGGNLTAVLIDLVGLDFGNSLLSALGIPNRTDLRCMVAEAELNQGRLDGKTLLVDTDEANITGKGYINLSDERIDLQIKTDPKKLNIAHVGTPIDIEGTLANPKIRPKIAPLAARGAAAVALGTLLTPLAALIPTIQLGLGEDNDCVALLKAAGAPRSEQQKAPPQSK